MTIDEAIALIEHCAKTHARYDRVEVKEALKLGIEALKYAKTSRDPSGNPAYSLLPGETLVSLNNEEKRRTQ